ncbi:MAG: hypothetical protein PQJ58_17240, partial [Spirochaetales bacterium]|nr:hypothetical protein [Spirochaetales bacterium]
MNKYYLKLAQVLTVSIVSISFSCTMFDNDDSGIIEGTVRRANIVENSIVWEVAKGVKVDLCDTEYAHGISLSPSFRSTSTFVVRSTTTDDQGFYRFSDLPLDLSYVIIAGENPHFFETSFRDEEHISDFDLLDIPELENPDFADIGYDARYPSILFGKIINGNNDLGYEEIELYIAEEEFDSDLREYVYTNVNLFDTQITSVNGEYDFYFPRSFYD